MVSIGRSMVCLSESGVSHHSPLNVSSPFELSLTIPFKQPDINIKVSNKAVRESNGLFNCFLLFTGYMSINSEAGPTLDSMGGAAAMVFPVTTD